MLVQSRADDCFCLEIACSNLTNPNTVVVYTNSDTQLLTTSSFAVGSVLRFYGLLFDDNGTLRMDCVQVNDGVAE